ncbi:ParB N-terminal domain-containing protein [Pseudomonas coronafaciens]|uniref:ParB N-terminal domain-containing protein n=1 Tax=Pseudomonas coronafaciens TaxID=53409 RepID=UPI0006D64256|nr:ParB N-terminal domain-containing protein [Pseudomonas coronafaciens]KPW30747.1 hypothetical protein ALO66_200080 [Pseudomonas coronafaciens pv. atropurpurea]
MSDFLNLPLRDLHFDPENPRLPNNLKHKGDEEVIKYLLLECNLVELMLSIGEHGFFAGEPLLVVPRKEGGWTVVEGNRRLGALKLLQKDFIPPVKPTQVAEARAITKHTPTSISTLRFDDRNEILSYLGYRHITGIKEWDALAKARYLRQLRTRHGADHEQAHRALAKEIGSKSAYVAKLLTGLTLVERARDIGLLSHIKLAEDDIQFSLLTTGIGYKNICEFIGISSPSDVEAKGLKDKEFSEFFTWVFDKSRTSTVLGESRNLEKLARVVHHSKALEELRRGVTLETADLYTSGPLEALRILLKETEDRLENALGTLSVAEGINGADVEQAGRIKKASTALHAALNGLLNPVE